MSTRVPFVISNTVILPFLVLSKTVPTTRVQGGRRGTVNPYEAINYHAPLTPTPRRQGARLRPAYYSNTKHQTPNELSPSAKKETPYALKALGTSVGYGPRFWPSARLFTSYPTGSYCLLILSH